MKLLIIQIPPDSCYFTVLRPRCFHGQLKSQYVTKNLIIFIVETSNIFDAAIVWNAAEYKIYIPIVIKYGSNLVSLRGPQVLLVYFTTLSVSEIRMGWGHAVA
jgi:hypothetical protein